MSLNLLDLPDEIIELIYYHKTKMEIKYYKKKYNKSMNKLNYNFMTFNNFKFNNIIKDLLFYYNINFLSIDDLFDKYKISLKYIKKILKTNHKDDINNIIKYVNKLNNLNNIPILTSEEIVNNIFDDIYKLYNDYLLQMLNYIKNNYDIISDYYDNNIYQFNDYTDVINDIINYIQIVIIENNNKYNNNFSDYLKTII